MLIGIQGAGKTTFYQRRFSDSHVRINLDMLRTRSRETLLLTACLEGGQRFVVDNTNVTPVERARYIALAKERRFRVVGYYFEPDARGAVTRNAARARHVPKVGIFGTLKRLVRPELSEGFDQLWSVSIGADGEFVVTALDPAPVHPAPAL